MTKMEQWNQILTRSTKSDKEFNQLNYSYDKVEGELGGRGELGEDR